LKKTDFAIRNNVFSLLLFFSCSFGFAFPRFVQLEKLFLQHFKSLKIEKNLEGFAKAFGDRILVYDGSVYFIFNYF